MKAAIITMWVFYFALAISIIFLMRNSWVKATVKPCYPYVVLNTEERINTGDTLYVFYADEDTVILWGK